ncbi:MAG: UDP-N-acetylmuramate--L-alanine ligase [Timaviella obliquedivisa GSE-PSE-MK23-08B]|jgi:UDP-N-acetylmuramate--alanine ligase|nr:UDP-N-acetylmuramate--L-alanine ligase [Timaviella obliquedivisa GSE-PSE-MK23-08B]
MLDAVDFSGRPFHFIGIGGIGMSALAHVLTQRNLPVSGSDLASSNITQRLEAQGAQIFLTQGAANITRVAQGVLPQVVCSTAISPANSEYRAAVELGCPIFHRSDLLAALMKQYQGIAIAGTHGKTTTSSMVGYLLLKAGLEPTIVIGGEVNAWEGNAYVGKGVHFVAEVDESDGSLVKHSAQIGVITNIELDHPDHYTTLEQVIDTFQIFARQCQQVIGCIDSPAVEKFIQPAITYSLSQAAADYTVDQVVYGADGTIALIIERGQVLGRLNLPILGEHNLSNALAAIAIGRLVGLEFGQIATILASFEGARRRFEHRGEYNRILFIDDYGHHPSEIQVTLAAARLRAESTTDPRRVIAVFQPHRYSRTQTFLAEFAESFGNADLVITTDIYSAGEADLGQVTGLQLAEAIATRHPQSIYQPSLQTVSAYLMETLLPGDLVLFLGAGNLNRVIPELMSFYQKIQQKQPIPSSIPSLR